MWWRSFKKDCPKLKDKPCGDDKNKPILKYGERRHHLIVKVLSGQCKKGSMSGVLTV